MFNPDVTNYDYMQHSFSYLDWSLLEQISQGSLSVNDLPYFVTETLTYSIIPGGNTILHVLTNHKDEFVKYLDLTLEDENKDGGSKMEDKKLKLEVPVMPNFDDKTALHLLADRNDYKRLNYILEYLSKYPIDHHSRAIKDLVPLFIEEELPALHPYMDSRLIETKQTQKMSKMRLQDDPYK